MHRYAKLLSSKRDEYQRERDDKGANLLTLDSVLRQQDKETNHIRSWYLIDPSHSLRLPADFVARPKVLAPIVASCSWELGWSSAVSESSSVRFGWKADASHHKFLGMVGSHEKLISDAAKITLHPLGFRRKGQSRLWFGDHHWWLSVVEFQPSGFRKGSYLNVSAHWLWSDGGYVSFDLGNGTDEGSRIAEFEEYNSDEQFEAAAHRLATVAAREARELANRLPSLGAAAELLLFREINAPTDKQGSWSALHAGVAAGLADRHGDAERMLRSITDDRVKAPARVFVDALSDWAQFKAVAKARIANQREALRLPRLNSPLF